MNKLYSNIEDLKKDLKENGEILLSDFSDDAVKTTPADTWVHCGCTSKGNSILAMNIEFGDVFSETPQVASMIRYIVVY
jgi:hypothetical protein